MRPVYLFVLPWSLSHLGGVNQVVKSLAHEMLRIGDFEPVVLISDWSAKTPIWEEYDGLKTIRWRIRGCDHRMSLKSRIVFYLWEMRFLQLFREFCIQHQVVAINPHYPGSVAFTLERIAKRITDIPFILSFHGADLSEFEVAGRERKRKWTSLVRRSDRVVACSAHLGKRIEKLFGGEVDPIVIHNGIDAPSFVLGACSAELPARRSILSIGKFERKKGQDVLVSAFAAVAADYPDVDLVLVGAAERELQNLKKLCVDEGIGARVSFYPDVPHNEVAKFFSRASVFCLPSRQEPFGLVILEAGAFALPVVASRVGGIPEILSANVTGLLVHPENPADLSQSIRYILDNPLNARAMGVRLRERVTKHFSWATAYEKYASIVKCLN